MSVDVIERLIEKSEETDKIVPVFLMFVPPVLIIFGTIFMIAEIREGSLLGFGLLMVILGAAVGVYLLYALISRRNSHFDRTTALYESIADYLNSSRLKDTVLRMKSEVGEEKSPAVWVIFYFLTSMIPFVGALVRFYIFHFLNKDFVKHDRNERIFLEQLSEIVPIGDTLKLSRIGKFPDINTVVYVVLAVLTLGLFEIYWFYTLINDPNEHFRDHRVVDAKILETLKSAKKE